MANKKKIDIITNEDSLIVKETLVHLSDEKIKTILSKTYEQAQKDMGKKSICDYYGCWFSISATLALTLATATFHDFLFFSANNLTNMAKIFFVLFAIGGIASLLLKLNTKTRTDTTNRDKAIDSVFSTYIREK